jgi:hypothetical protein
MCREFKNPSLLRPHQSENLGAFAIRAIDATDSQDPALRGYGEADIFLERGARAPRPEKRVLALDIYNVRHRVKPNG